MQFHRIRYHYFILFVCVPIKDESKMNLFVTPHNKDNGEDDTVKGEYEDGDHRDGVVEGEGVVLRHPERHTTIIWVICCLCNTKHIHSPSSPKHFDVIF